MNQAILIRDIKTVEIIHKEMPVRKPGEVLLKILYGGICGSDLGSYRGSFPIPGFRDMNFPQRFWKWMNRSRS